MNHPRYTLPAYEKPKRNPWPDRILMAGCLTIIGLTGTLLLAGWFQLLDDTPLFK